MSPGLRGEVVKQLSQRTLEAVWYMRELSHASPDFLVHVAQRLGHVAYAPREKIFYTVQLNIVAFGVGGRGGEMLSPGQVRGTIQDLRAANIFTPSNRSLSGTL